MGSSPSSQADPQPVITSEKCDIEEKIDSTDSEMQEELAKLRDEAVKRVTLDLEFHSRRAEYLANQFKEEMILDPMQLDIMRKTQLQIRKMENTKPTKSVKSIERKYAQPVSMLKTQNQVIDEIAALNLRSPNIFPNLTATMNKLDDAKKTLEEEKEKLRELKAEYRRLKAGK